jgi:lipoprotein-releasing system ATP-binding protein
MGRLVDVKGLVKDYPNINETINVLRGLDFYINKNEMVAITGESGSGKSTLLNLIGGLDYPTAGSIKIDGMEITGLDEDELTNYRNKKIGFIFQQHYLLEDFTALENVMMPFLIGRFNKKYAKEKAKNLLSFMGLEERFEHYPSQLSGGEKQRVAIARAFINEPILILADEPTGNLDEKNADKVLELLFGITNKEEHSMIIVSHSNQVVKMAYKTYHLESGKLSLNKKIK